MRTGYVPDALPPKWVKEHGQEDIACPRCSGKVWDAETQTHYECPCETR